MIAENFLVDIMKLLMLPTVKANLRKAEKMMEEDPEFQSMLQTMQIQAKLLQDKLPDFCKRHPESNLCKDKSKKRK